MASDLIEDWSLYYRMAQRLGLIAQTSSPFRFAMGAHLDCTDLFDTDRMEQEQTTA